MYMNEDSIRAEFRHTGQTAILSQTELCRTISEFLERYGTTALLGKEFCKRIGSGSGASRFRRLLEATGFGGDATGFCRELVRKLENADSRDSETVALNGVALPHLLLVAVLEEMIPGEKFTSVKTVAQFEKLTNTRVPDRERDDLQKVMEAYPVRFSTHLMRQMRVSRNVAYQYLPFVEELDPAGHVNTWIGQFHQGLLEQMYQNRVIFLLNMSCPVYCRFCFRKHKDSRNQANPTPKDVKRAVDYVRRTPSIKEIVITGGDPFMNRENLACAIDGLKEIDHVQTLRLATRSIAYYPNLFLARNDALLKYVKAKNLELQMVGKRMEIATHFIHPDEISPQSLTLITDLVNNGIPVYVQTPFLKDCNDKGPELTRLFGLLRGAGAELHYIYIPCSPIQGNSVYWTPLSAGLQVAHYLRANLSDRVIPRICTATPIGKMDWHTSGWAVKPDPDNSHFVWLRTPYTPDYFTSFAPLTANLDILKVNDEGTIDVRYMAQIGDDALFYGDRRPHPLKTVATDSDTLDSLQERLRKDQRITRSIVDTGCEGIYRTHQTRVEIDLDYSREDLAYLRTNDAITDVVLSHRGDALDKLYDLNRIIARLREMDHINAVRIRSLEFNYSPSRWNRTVIAALGDLNRLNVAHPLRLEIETQFLTADEIQPAHKVLAENLRNKGITVYNNTPLLTDINDSAEIINRLAYRLRDCGIEFHHLYVAGLPIQQSWNDGRPVDVADVIDIASRVRKDGSGREIPRYIILTNLGEVDFGLTSRLLAREGRIFVELTPYDLNYYRQMSAGFEWPEGVEATPDGHAVVEVTGLTDTGGFMVAKLDNDIQK
jgi:KamA family protein